jgi:hypothetical protein
VNELGIDTTGWVRCGSPGCRWLLEPDSPCPEHSDGPPLVAPDPDDAEAVAAVKRSTLEQEAE